jgi:hypothetical protein
MDQVLGAKARQAYPNVGPVKKKGIQGIEQRT